MVKYVYLFMFFFLVLPGVSYSTPELLLTVDKTETELGLPISVKLFAIDIQRPLDEIKLDSLNENFALVLDDKAEEIEDGRWPGVIVQTLRFKIYPRITGTLPIHAINFANATSKPQLISVKQGMVRNQIINFSTNISTLNPWERQQVIIKVTITTPELFSSLESATPNLPGFEVIALPTTRNRVNANGAKFSELQFGWAFFPLSAADYNIELPAVDYSNNGRIQRRYFLPLQSISVKHLPTYIPPTIPVGKVSISSSMSGPNVLNTNTLTYWTISILGPALSTHWLPPLLRQIKSDQHIHFLHTKTDKVTTPNFDGINGQVSHTIALKSLSSGKLSLPTLRFQYFDPDNGRLITVKHHPQQPIVIASVWRWLISCCLLLCLLWVSMYTYRIFKSRYVRHQKRKLAITGMKQAHAIDELRSAMQLVADAEGWPANLSLRELSVHWIKNHLSEPYFPILLQQLSAAYYGKRDGSGDENHNLKDSSSEYLDSKSFSFNNLRTQIILAYQSQR